MLNMLYNNPMIKIKTIRYLFEAILGINLLIITRILGLKLSSKIFSWVFSNLGPKLNISNQAKENLLIAFPNIKDPEIKTIIFKMWENIGMVAAEFFHLRKISEERNTRIKVIGEEYINKYKNNGVIFVSGHFANWEIIPLILRNYRNNVGGIYRHSNNFFVNDWVVRQRYKNTTPIQIRKGSSGAREMLNLLKENGAIAMLVDQKLSSGVRVKFFGSDAMTSDGAASLAIKYNYPVIPMNVERTKGSNFKVSFHPEIKINKTSDKQNDIKIFSTEINKFLEQCITKKPEGWFWIHNRWDKKFNLN